MAFSMVNQCKHKHSHICMCIDCGFGNVFICLFACLYSKNNKNIFVCAHLSVLERNKYSNIRDGNDDDDSKKFRCRKRKSNVNNAKSANYIWASATQYLLVDIENPNSAQTDTHKLTHTYIHLLY